ncbi:MAG: F0F1 ATP synthase subunit delta [Pseudomonadota bacterium]
MSVDQAPDRTLVPGLAGRYATALFELARDASAIDVVAGELSALKAEIAEGGDLALLVQSPRIGKAEKLAAVKAIAQSANLSALTANFLGTLAQNGRLAVLAQTADAFQTLLAHHRGEISADVRAAHALTDRQQDALKAKLRAVVGRDVAVNVTVDETLLGGLVVKVGSKMIDSSLKTKLDRLEVAMKGAD